MFRNGGGGGGDKGNCDGSDRKIVVMVVVAMQDGLGRVSESAGPIDFTPETRVARISSATCH